MVSLCRLALLLGCTTPAVTLRLATEGNANPIRKVVNMLQAMQKKIQSEGETEEKLYEKFMCWCKTGAKDLTTSIGSAEVKLPQLASQIEEHGGKLEQSKSSLAQAQESRTAAKQAISEATALREKEAGSYGSFKSESDTNIAALKKAVAALEKGMAGAFLQTGDAQILRRILSNNIDLADYDRSQLASFLSHNSKYAPKSGEITGILKEMQETMEKSLDEATAAENEAIANYNELVAAKKKEIESLTSTVEEKTAQIGELGIELVQMKNDQDETSATLAEDQKFLAGLDTSCKTKTAEWTERQKTRAEELVALADTIKVLNDDDALELFKGTLGKGDSLLQMSIKIKDQRASALATIRYARKHAVVDGSKLDLLAVALSGKANFDKVLKMIDDMVALLKKEQREDDDKKAYCATSLDTTEDKAKKLERDVGDRANEIATTQDSLSEVTNEIASLTAGIKELDKQVAEATEQRKKENADYKNLMASDSAAKRLLDFAKNRLNKFYNPKLYKPPAKVELSAEDRISDNFGMPTTTQPAGGIADTGIKVMLLAAGRVAPPPPPETFDAYTKKSQENTGVIAMIDLLISDLDKEMVEAETGEKNAQKDYETLMKDSADKRMSDSESLTSKTSAKADTEARLSDLKESKTRTSAELIAVQEYMSGLHGECDFLMKYHAARKESRADEIDSMQKAHATLKGADFR